MEILRASGKLVGHEAAGTMAIALKPSSSDGQTDLEDDLEALGGIGAIDDLHRPVADLAQSATQLWPGIWGPPPRGWSMHAGCRLATCTVAFRS